MVRSLLTPLAAIAALLVHSVAADTPPADCATYSGNIQVELDTTYYLDSGVGVNAAQGIFFLTSDVSQAGSFQINTCSDLNDIVCTVKHPSSVVMIIQRIRFLTRSRLQNCAAPTYLGATMSSYVPSGSPYSMSPNSTNYAILARVPESEFAKWPLRLAAH